MKKSIVILSIISVLFIANHLFSVEELLPKWPTEEELTRMPRVNIERDQTEPPFQPSRSVAEFERMSAVLIRYPLGIPLSLVALMSEEIEVITLVANISVQNQAMNDYLNSSVVMENCSFLVAPTNSIWTRDYGPWFIFDGNNEVGIMDFEYNRPRPLDNAINSIFADEYEINYYHMGLLHEGGDYMSDGMGIAASTHNVYNINTDFTHNEINAIMNTYLGIHEYHVVPNIHGGLSHIDTWGKFLAPDKILIRQVDPSHQYYHHAEQAAEYFGSQISSYGRPFRVYRIYTPSNEPYTNSLILNNRVFVPVTGSHWDNAAIQTYEQAMPGYEVYGIPYGHWGSTDALHCRTKDIADREMLYIYHEPVINDQQSHLDYEIQATIIPMSGEPLIDGYPRVFFRVDDGEFTLMEMLNIEDYTYTAFIPQQEEGSEIHYYIEAADASGRLERHPFIGEYDPHVFNVIGPVVFLGYEIDDTYYGNDNGYFEVGETVEVKIIIKNAGENMIEYLTASLSGQSEFISIHQPGEVFLEDLFPDEITELSFIVFSSLATPDNYTALFELEINTDCGLYLNEYFEIEIDYYVIQEYLVNENFDSWLPTGWETTSSSNNINWQHSYTSLAGGNVPEARFFYSPSTIGLQRLISPSVNTSSFSHIYLEFKHLINNYDGGYSIRVETSGDNGNTWTEIVSYPTVNMPSNTETILIDNNDVGSENFRISWTFEGDSWDINWWNIDDVIIGGINIIDDIAFFEGNVTFNSGYGVLTQVLITAGDQMTYPDEQGFFSLAVVEGVYDISVNAAGYVPLIIEDVYISSGETLNLDFQLEYIAPPYNLDFELNLPVVNLFWEIENYLAGESPKNEEKRSKMNNNEINLDKSRPVTHFNIYRKINDNDFIIAGIANTPNFEDELEESGLYEYFVTAVYDNKYESESSNVIKIKYLDVTSEATQLQTKLKGNYPNPFNPDTRIHFSLAEESNVKIEIFNIKGQKVVTLVNEVLTPGNHQIFWNGKDYYNNLSSSGIYFYRMQTQDYNAVHKMLLIK